MTTNETTTLYIPIHTGSNPNSKSAGPNKGITINIISIKSNINPKKNIIVSIMINVVVLSTSVSKIISLINSSPSSPLNTN